MISQDAGCRERKFIIKECVGKVLAGFSQLMRGTLQTFRLYKRQDFVD
jgi:hypothetical protein